MLTFGSLFAGIGGLDLGLERAGMVCKWQVEIDDYATRVLEKHWPNVHRERDIRECGKHNLECVDVICGGFPCQDISYAGQGAGLDGARSGLFFEAVRLVRELQPRIVVLENVAALLTRGLDRVLGTLAEIGFDAEWHCIPAAAVGAPHIRDRLFVLAYAERSGVSERRGVKVFATVGGGPGISRDDRASGEKQAGQILADANNTRSQRVRKERQDSGRANTNGHVRQSSLGDGDESEQWQVEPDVGRVANGVPARVDRLRGLGNAVVPQVAEWIGRRIVDSMKATQ